MSAHETYNPDVLPATRAAKRLALNPVNRLTLGLGLVGLALGLPTLRAAAWQDPQEIRDVAHDYIAASAAQAHGAQPTVIVNPPDSRLRLAQCPQSLEAFIPPGGRTLGRTVVGVRCPAGKRWSIFVPVEIRIERTLAVAARPLPRGTHLKKGDLRLAIFDVSQIRGSYITDVDEALGTVLKRPISVGQPVTATVLRTPRMIKRGQAVTLVLQVGAITVRGRGKALADGGRGDRIRVRNNSSRRVVEGRVISPDTVEVGH